MANHNLFVVEMFKSMQQQHLEKQLSIFCRGAQQALMHDAFCVNRCLFHVSSWQDKEENVFLCGSVEKADRYLGNVAILGVVAMWYVPGTCLRCYFLGCNIVPLFPSIKIGCTLASVHVSHILVCSLSNAVFSSNMCL